MLPAADGRISSDRLLFQSKERTVTPHASEIILLTLIAALVAAPVFAASGGPDAWGYTWVDDSEPGGPTPYWADITAVGTEHDLGHETVVGPIPLGFQFPYYWESYDRIWIGSNGWVSFDGVGNLSHCFPSMPTPGGLDNVIAPLMADFTFTGPSVDARLFTYYDSGNQLFVVSWIDVPFAAATSGGWQGSNTFQMVLSGLDGTITFQYLDTDPAFFVNTGTCANDSVIGIENITGNIGLEALVEVLPSDMSAIRFDPPSSPSLSIPDATPRWNQRPDNGGVFAIAGSPIPISSHVFNAGNATIPTTIDLDVQLLDASLTPVYDDHADAPPLGPGAEFTVPMTPAESIDPGRYTLRSITSHVSDLNPSNNTTSTELGVIDVESGMLSMTWAGPNEPEASVEGWAHAVYFEPPMYPVRASEIRFWAVDDGGGAGRVRVQLFDDDGPGDGPGALLASTTVEAGTYSTNRWTPMSLSCRPRIDSGGVFVAWVPVEPDLGLGAESVGPISRHGWSRRDRDWTRLADRDTTDLFIGLTVDLLPDEVIFDDDLECGLGPWTTAVGAVTYDSIDRDGIAAMNPQLSSSTIDFSDGSEFFPGTWLVYRTDADRHGKLIVDRYDYPDVRISWVTYNSDGSVYSQGQGLRIRGTFECDLDLGVSAAAGADWFWNQVSQTERYLFPRNGAVFKLMERSLVP
jgi:hypothetical protein